MPKPIEYDHEKWPVHGGKAGGDCLTRIVRPCVSWRQCGGFWSIHEDGEGERLRISNSVRDIDIDDLRDKDLEILQHLIATAIGFRKTHGPNSQHDVLGEANDKQ
jgi:hypothetical protein